MVVCMDKQCEEMTVDTLQEDKREGRSAIISEEETITVSSLLNILCRICLQWHLSGEKRCFLFTCIHSILIQCSNCSHRKQILLRCIFWFEFKHCITRLTLGQDLCTSTLIDWLIDWLITLFSKLLRGYYGKKMCLGYLIHSCCIPYIENCVPTNNKESVHPHTEFRTKGTIKGCPHT